MMNKKITFTDIMHGGMKSCPFCGNEPTLYFNVEEDRCYIECPSCGAGNAYCQGTIDKMSEVVKAWNNRKNV